MVKFYNGKFGHSPDQIILVGQNIGKEFLVA